MDATPLRIFALSSFASFLLLLALPASPPYAHAHQVPQSVLSTIDITGSSVGAVTSSFLFTATLKPAQLTAPFTATYVWQATEQAQVVTTTSNLSTTVTFSWDKSGPKIITVTAISATRRMTDTHRITIGVPPATLTLRGPTQGKIKAPYRFEATVAPTTTLPPLIYTWLATEQRDPSSKAVTNTGGISDSANFTWKLPGPKYITVTAASPIGIVTATHVITMSVPPMSLELSGPMTGTISTRYPFVATASPTDTTLPLRYKWQTSTGDMITDTAALTSKASFSWDTPGLKTFTVTATNDGGGITTTHRILIISPTSTFVTIPADQAKEVVSRDGRVHLQFPTGTLVDPAIVIFNHITHPTHPLLPHVDVLYSFSLEAYSLKGQPLQLHRPSVPVAGMISYAEDQLATFLSDDQRIHLLAWDGKAWIPVASMVDTVNNRVAFEIEQFTEFALVSDARKGVFLPLIRTKH